MKIRKDVTALLGQDGNGIESTSTDTTDKKFSTVSRKVNPRKPQQILKLGIMVLYQRNLIPALASVWLIRSLGLSNA